MAFKYNIIRAFEDEKAEGKAEGKAEDVIVLLDDVGTVSEALKKRILEQKDLEILKSWLKIAACSKSVEEFENMI